MTTIAFDTLKAAEGLEAAGMDARQAKAVVGTVAEAFSDTVATKADIAEVRADLKTGLAKTQGRHVQGRHGRGHRHHLGQRYHDDCLDPDPVLTDFPTGRETCGL